MRSSGNKYLYEKLAWCRIASFDRSLKHRINDKSTYGSSVESLRSLARMGIEFKRQVGVHKCLTSSTTSFSFSANFDASSIGDRPNLNVPSGFDALPRKVKTSPFVSIPLTPVPLISSKFVTGCSNSRRCTEGKRGRECSALRATVLWSTGKSSGSARSSEIKKKTNDAWRSRLRQGCKLPKLLK